MPRRSRPTLASRPSSPASITKPKLMWPACSPSTKRQMGTTRVDLIFHPRTAEMRPRTCYSCRRLACHQQSRGRVWLLVTVEMLLGNEILERDGDRLVEATGFGWTEHGRLRTYVPLG